ncbi:MAG: polysaccharide deacetylase family protein [Bacteroidales bacterium]
MRIPIAYLLLPLLIFLQSCTDFPEQHEGKIMLSFDDQYIDNWYAHMDLYEKYNARLCFYVTRPGELSDADFEKLRELQAEGHMIGSHGMHHQHVDAFKNATAYYQAEVLPAIELFAENGIDVITYAYPYGKGCSEVDSLLISKGLSIRYAGWNRDHVFLPKADRFYISKPKPEKFLAIGMDENYRIGRLDLLYGLERAANENSILVLHAHDISKKEGDYKLDPAKLEYLLHQCQKHGISFYLPGDSHQ